MLVRLLRTHLRPYAGYLSLVVVLQLVGTIASLYLPSLNADIIDNGVAKGDTGYIMSTGGWMLGVSLIQILCTVVAVYYGAKTAAMFGRDVRAGGVPPGRRVLGPRGEPVRRADADLAQHERRHPGADACRHHLHDAGRRPDHDGRRPVHGHP